MNQINPTTRACLSVKSKFRSAGLLLAGAAFALLAGASLPAYASDPAPGDAVTLPPNVNLAIVYNQFGSTGSFVTSNGTSLHHTRGVDDVTILRFVRSFEVGGFVSGVQVYLPYVGFLGSQKVGGGHVPSASGFAQPNFGAFSWLVNTPKLDVVLGGWLSPPISSFNKNGAALQAANNTMFEQIELGAHYQLLGMAGQKNLAFEAWGDGYLYQDNTGFATGTTFREQPTEELRAYLNYTYDPASDGFVTLGFYQSFGGKQTLLISGLKGAVDTGNRTDESQLRVAATMFIAPTVQVMGYGYFDVAAHGGAENRILGVRMIKIF